MVHYKLLYFPVRNLGEAIRLTFHYAGVEFEDFRIPLEKWPTEYKNKTPYGTVPVLQIDDVDLCESGTILRYLAKKFNLVDTLYEETKVDELIQVHLNEYGKIKPYLMVKGGFEQGNADELFESVAKPTCEFYFAIWSQILKETGTGFLVGNRPTPADFFLADYLHSLMKMAPVLFNRFTDLKYFVERIYSLPQLEKYIKSRIDSDL